MENTTEYINQVYYKGKLLLDDSLRYNATGLASFHFKIEIPKAKRKLIIQCALYGKEAESFERIIHTGSIKTGKMIEVKGSTNDYIKTTSTNKKYVYYEAHIKEYRII